MVRRCRDIAVKNQTAQKQGRRERADADGWRAMARLAYPHRL